MFAKIKSSGLIGINGYIINVETDISNGMPGFEIVGLPDAAVKEARERVRSEIKNSGLYFPSTRIIVNLAPADTKKEGAVYDLAIASAILYATGQLIFKDNFAPVVLGELSIDGDIRPVAGVLPMIVMYSDRELTVKEVIVRKIIQFLLIEMSIIFIIFGKDFMFSEHRQLLFAIALCIFIVFVFANIISWEMDRVVARRMTEKLISLQTSSLQNKN